MYGISMKIIFQGRVRQISDNELSLVYLKAKQKYSILPMCASVQLRTPLSAPNTTCSLSINVTKMKEPNICEQLEL